MKSNNPLYLSLVIPCFNEDKRIKLGLQRAVDYLKQQKYTWEIILVDDGSTDQTYKLASKIIRETERTGIKRIRMIQHEKNLGKGATVKTGILTSQGKYVVFSDIDLSTPISELPKLLRSLRDSQVAIGVRRHPESRVIKHQPILRELLGQVFTKLTNWLVVPGIYDVTCGFKGFQSIAAKKIFSQVKIARWAFDAEVLYLARKNKFKIAQVPIIWSDNHATKVNMFCDGWRAFWDLVRIKFG